MKLIIRLALASAILFGANNLAHAQAPVTTIEWAPSVSESGDGVYEVHFTGKILPGWHTYDMHSDLMSTLVEIESHDGLTLEGAAYEVTPSKREWDDIFEVEIGTYYEQIVLGQKVKLTGETGTLKGLINWRACEDENCNSPEDWFFEVSIGAGATGVSASVAPQSGGTDVSRGAARDEVSVAGKVAKATMWGAIVAAILWGLAALVTPCVFPMIPMTVSFFLKGSGSARKGRFRALMYGIFIVLLYTLPIAALILITRFVGGDAVTADIFNWIATHWIPNLIFFLVFMLFAASFFGAFEITLPSWMVNKSDKNADKGGLVGVFFMALTLVLVSFSCTGPMVGSAIMGSLSGDFWMPIVTMLAFSITFALPFTLFAFFPSLLKNLPKSGGWLSTVKVVLGFIEVALGLKFLSMADQTYHWGILDREVYLAIWIVCFGLLGLYLLGKIRFKHDDEVKHVSVTRLTLAIISLSFTVYMIPGMWGAPLRALSGYMPPLATQDFVIGASAGAAPIGGAEAAARDGQAIKYADILHWPYDLPGYFDLKQAEEVAQRVEKPLFVDITGIACVNCREMEARVWSDPRVQQLLRDNFVLVALYTDDKTKLPENEWVTTPNGRQLKDMGRVNSYIAQTRFGVNGQPNYLILGRDGEEIVPRRAYDLDIEAYIAFLKAGIEAYK